MPTADQLSVIVRNLCRSRGDAAIDGDLLGQFATQRDEKAFAELVRRHGPLVLSVALRHAPNRQTAEDVVQVTFLALARQATCLGRPPSLINWLYTVAVRTAQTEYRRSARHSAMLRRAPITTSVPEPSAEVDLRETLRIIDEELSRLPPAYLSPILLCGIEGLSRDEAAQRLRWPAGSLKGRLERGRELLRGRLAARGVKVPALLAGGLLNASAAALPPSLAQSVVRAALATPMAVSWAKPVLLAGILCTAIGIGAGMIGLSGGNEQQSEKRSAPEELAEVADELGATKARLDADGLPLPNSALLRLGSGRFRHGERIFGSVLSPDGKRLATCAMHTIAVWDLATGRRLRHFLCEGDTSTYGGLAFSDDGSRLAHVDTARACVWDLESGKEVFRFTKEPGWSFCRFTADGRELILKENNLDGKDPINQLIYRDLQTGEVKRTLAFSGIELLSPDLRTYVRLRNSQPIIVGDVRTGKGEKELKGSLSPGDTGSHLAFSADGKALATGHSTKEIRIYDLPAGTLRTTFPMPASANYDHAGNVFVEYSLAFSPDTKVLILGTAGGCIHRWDIASGKELPLLKKPLTARNGSNNISGVYVLPGRRTLVSTGGDGRIRIWDLSKNEEIPQTESFAGHVRAAYSADGRVVVVGDQTGRIDIWSAVNGKRLQTIRESGPAVRSIAFAPDSQTLAAGLDSGAIQLWDVPSGQEAKSLRHKIDWAPARDEYVTKDTLVFSPNGRYLYVSYFPHHSELWDLTTHQLNWEGKEDRGGAVISPDSSTITVSGGHSIRHLDILTGGIRRTDRIGGSDPLPVALSANGRLFALPVEKRVAVCDAGTGLQWLTWDIKNKLPPWAQNNGPAQVHAVAFAPDGQYLATAAVDGGIQIWDLFRTQKVLQFEGHEPGWSSVTNLQFAPDGKTLLSAGVDGQVFLWSLKPAPAPIGSLDDLWSDLGSEADAVAAHRAVWALSANPRAVAYLKAKLPPAVIPNREHVTKLIAGLDSDEFKTRESAAKQLSAQGKAAVPFLEEALKRKTSAEALERIRGLLSTVNRWPIAADVRPLRAVRALELAGGPAAREHLKALAGGAANATLTQAAGEALKRLGP